MIVSDLKVVKSYASSSLRYIVSGLLFLFLSSLCYAQIDLSTPLSESLGEHVTFIPEPGQSLDINQARALLKLEGIQSDQSVLSFGINARPVWLKLTVNNPDRFVVNRSVKFETSWLDKIEAYQLQKGKLLDYKTGGDAIPFSLRQHGDRFVSFSFAFQPGVAELYFRVEAEDPLVVPIYILTDQQLEKIDVQNGYVYGLLYGFLIALLAYNALLTFSLNSRRYLFYSQYLLFFLLMNLSYTGHAFQWLWPEMVTWQRWSNPLLMVLYAVSGLFFAQRFLAMRHYLPRLNRFINVLTSCSLLLSIAAIFLNDAVFMLYIAFIMIPVFSVLMIFSGALALYQGMKEARYFLAATLFATIGAICTALTVSGVVTYRPIGFHAVEVGMLIEAILFALALAYQFRIDQESKIKAERLADIDQLTGLYNRRGFEKIKEPIFSTAIRKQRNLSLMILDIDHFKSINDSYGHGVGDLVLQQLADILLAEVRTGDVISRWGGEEFLLLLPETDLQEGVSLADRLLVKVAQLSLSYKGEPVSVTASIGVSSLRTDAQNFSILLNEADKYLYEAKRSGRNQVGYDKNSEQNIVLTHEVSGET